MRKEGREGKEVKGKGSKEEMGRRKWRGRRREEERGTCLPKGYGQAMSAPKDTDGPVSTVLVAVPWLTGCLLLAPEPEQLEMSHGSPVSV